MDTKNLSTRYMSTWCPGCPNFFILESTKRAIASLISQGYKHENFSMTTGIGCHAKIFDYINISGIYGLHGRVIPTCLGITLGNPNLTVLGFALSSFGISIFKMPFSYVALAFWPSTEAGKATER